MEARYAAADWVAMPSGTQALADAIVSFDCELSEARLVGTHHILIGRVAGLRSRQDGNALVYFDRNYVHVPAQIGSFGG
jgi:flavin reductase